MSNIKISLIGDIVVPSSPVKIDYTLNPLFIANLEAPIGTDEELSIPLRPKSGSVLRSYKIPEEFQGGVFSLANNHMMDFGFDGVQLTQKTCNQLKINSIGAGKNLQDSRIPHIVQSGDVRIGILARCETQFGNATHDRGGVAPLDPTIYGAISKLKQETDIVVVSIHGAAELCPWPSPKWQDLLRSFIDAGASLVHGHHAHIPQGYEEYNGGLIFYGLGNFLVDPNNWRDVPNALWSIVGEVSFCKKGIKQFNIKTSTIKEGQKVTVCESDAGEFAAHQEYISMINNPLNNRNLLEGLWQEFSIRMYRTWNEKWLGFDSMIGWGKLKRRFSHLVKNRINNNAQRDLLKNVSASQMDYLLWYHLLACESHCDSIVTALGVLGSELDDKRTSETKGLADKLMSWSIY